MPLKENKIHDKTTYENIIRGWWCFKENYYKYVNFRLYKINIQNNNNNKKRLISTSKSSLVVILETATLIFIAATLLQPVQGGSCWTMTARTGRCMELVSEHVSREDCCNIRGAAIATAYNPEDMDAGTIFFWRALGGGVHCTACRESCLGVECGPGKKCMLRNGQPRCVCEPECRKGGGRHQRGPVCGTDGRSYRNVCRLRKRACRRHSSLAVAYPGHCQRTCERIHCPENKQCLLDQNLTPHCVKCTRRCPSGAHGHNPLLGTRNAKGSGSRLVCGTDGSTYASPCHLREAACRKGKAIPLAYRGRCKPSASCSNVRCRDRQACLVDMHTGHPRCVTCGLRCGGKDGTGGPICGTNNLTYQSWCHMLQDACATGYVIETKHPGNCSVSTTSSSSLSQTAERNSAVSNTVFIAGNDGDTRFS